MHIYLTVYTHFICILITYCLFVAFGQRAWFVMQVMHGADPTQGIVPGLAPKIFIFSGGNIGNSTLDNKKLLM
jgi:hypothetical protein